MWKLAVYLNQPLQHLENSTVELVLYHYVGSCCWFWYVKINVKDCTIKASVCLSDHITASETPFFRQLIGECPTVFVVFKNKPTVALSAPIYFGQVLTFHSSNDFAFNLNNHVKHHESFLICTIHGVSSPSITTVVRPFRRANTFTFRQTILYDPFHLKHPETVTSSLAFFLDRFIKLSTRGQFHKNDLLIRRQHVVAGSQFTNAYCR